MQLSLRKIFSSFIFCLCLSGLAYAQTSLAGLKRELTEIDSQLEKNQLNSQMLAEQIRQLQESQASFQARADSVKERLLLMEKDFLRVSKEVEKDLEQFKPFENEIELLQQRAMERMRLAYIFGSRNVLTSIFTNESEQDKQISFLRAGVYLSAMKKGEQKLLADLEKKFAIRDVKQAEIKKAEQALTDLRRKIEDEERQLAEQRQWESDLLLKFTEQQKLLQKQVGGLNARKSKINAFLAKLAGSGRVQADELRNQMATKSQKASEATKANQFAGKGLAELKGILNWPIDNYRQLRGFGRYEQDGVDEVLFSKGLELVVPSQSGILAIAPGQVVFAGNMPGYGLVIIVDHGQRYYTVYGKLSSVFVSPGGIVTERQKIGASSIASAGQANFYFEIRENGAAQNPKLFLRNQAAADN